MAIKFELPRLNWDRELEIDMLLDRVGDFSRTNSWLAQIFRFIKTTEEEFADLGFHLVSSVFESISMEMSRMKDKSMDEIQNLIYTSCVNQLHCIENIRFKVQTHELGQGIAQGVHVKSNVGGVYIHELGVDVSTVSLSSKAPGLVNSSYVIPEIRLIEILARSKSWKCTEDYIYTAKNCSCLAKAERPNGVVGLYLIVDLIIFSRLDSSVKFKTSEHGVNCEKYVDSEIVDSAILAGVIDRHLLDPMRTIREGSMSEYEKRLIRSLDNGDGTFSLFATQYMFSLFAYEAAVKSKSMTVAMADNVLMFKGPRTTGMVALALMTKSLGIPLPTSLAKDLGRDTVVCDDDVVATKAEIIDLSGKSRVQVLRYLIDNHVGDREYMSRLNGWLERSKASEEVKVAGMTKAQADIYGLVKAQGRGLNASLFESNDTVTTMVENGLLFLSDGLLFCEQVRD